MTTLEDRIRDIVETRIAAGGDRGVQVSVRRHGEVLVELALGIADTATGRPMTADTPIFSWSVGKGVSAAIVHLLAQRRQLDYDAPLADVWSEFAAHGKDAVTLRHVLTHSAGLPAIPMTTTPEKMCDWDGMCAAIAGMEPWWEPGTRTGYHAYTFGYLLGEVVRRATGRSISDLLRADITEPLGIVDELYFGVPPSEHHRVAPLEQGPSVYPTEGPLPDLPVFRTAPIALFPTAALGNRPDILAADIPALATTTARALATLYDALITGRLLDPDRLHEATRPAFTGTDAIFGNPATWSLGYALGLPFPEDDPTLTVFGMGGSGGAHAWADTATGVSFSLTKNRMDATSDVAVEIIGLVRDATA